MLIVFKKYIDRKTKKYATKAIAEANLTEVNPIKTVRARLPTVLKNVFSRKTLSKFWNMKTYEKWTHR